MRLHWRSPLSVRKDASCDRLSMSVLLSTRRTRQLISCLASAYATSVLRRIIVPLRFTITLCRTPLACFRMLGGLSNIVFGMYLMLDREHAGWLFGAW